MPEIFETIEDVITEKGWYVTTISGNSMFPMLRHNRDQILAKRPEGRLKPYDVAIYKHSRGHYIVHRVIRVCDGYYIIRGDNCIGLEFVPDERVIGIVTGFWRGDRYYDVTDKAYLRYAHLWVAFNPAIRLYRRLVRVLSSLLP